MNAMTSRSNSLFDDFFNDLAPGFFIRPLHGDPLPSPAQIKVDVQEDTNAYNVVAELPGVKKEDIQVSVEGSTVTLRAEIKQEGHRKDARTLRNEHYFGAVARNFQLPQWFQEKLAYRAYLTCARSYEKLNIQDFTGASQAGAAPPVPATEYSALGALRVCWNTSSVSPRMAA